MPNSDKSLAAAVERHQALRTTELLDSDPDRARRYRCSGAGLTLDYSKHCLDDDARDALYHLAAQARLAEAYQGLIAGEQVNTTEQRPALHTLLRGTASRENHSRYVAVSDTLERMKSTVRETHQGTRTGHSGQLLTDVVNIGIGGSDLGPRMVCEALRNPGDPMRAHFVANVDPWDLEQVLDGLNPHTTLFVVCSKSFNTEETLSNAQRARAWLLAAGVSADAISHHVLAVTTNIEAAVAFGIDSGQCYPIWDWVGGRYSLWSAIGLVIALQSGWEAFTELLDGAQTLDSHTGSSKPAENLPMTMALLEWWHCQLRGCGNHLILPYAQRLAQLPALLQQLTMESNGKRVDLSGTPLALPSAPMLWGSAGTIGQHSYYQLLHQGNRDFTADLILPLTNGDVDREAHRRLAANALAQSRALLVGRDASTAADLAENRNMPSTAAPHLELPGNHSHSVIWFDRAGARQLGALIAAYEHKTFFLGKLLNINPFDQWGVELGKTIGQQILGILDTGEGMDTLDPGTADTARAWRDANPG